MSYVQKVGLTLVAASVFGVVEALIFFLAETELENVFEEDFEMNTISAQLLTGGLSSAIAILCFSYVHDYMNKKYKLLDLHVLQSIGLIIGTVLIIILYNIIRGKHEEEEKENKQTLKFIFVFFNT